MLTKTWAKRFVSGLSMFALLGLMIFPSASPRFAEEETAPPAAAKMLTVRLHSLVGNYSPDPYMDYKDYQVQEGKAIPRETSGRSPLYIDSSDYGTFYGWGTQAMLDKYTNEINNNYSGWFGGGDTKPGLFKDFDHKFMSSEINPETGVIDLWPISNLISQYTVYLLNDTISNSSDNDDDENQITVFNFQNTPFTIAYDQLMSKYQGRIMENPELRAKTSKTADQKTSIHLKDITDNLSQVRGFFGTIEAYNAKGQSFDEDPDSEIDVFYNVYRDKIERGKIYEKKTVKSWKSNGIYSLYQWSNPKVSVRDADGTILLQTIYPNSTSMTIFDGEKRKGMAFKGLVSAPEKPGYTFEAWSLKPQNQPLEEVDLNNTVVYDMTIYAHYKKNPYKVTFYNEDGTQNKVVKVVPGKIIGSENLPVLEEQTGVTFAGWFPKTGDTETQVTGQTVPKGDLDLYPRYTVNVTTDLNYDDAPTGTSTTIAKGATLIPFPQEPTREGYRFLGWFDAKRDGNPITEETTFKTSTTIFAQWNKLVTFTIDPMDGTGEKKITVDGGSKVGENLPADPKKEGYRFVGWVDESGQPVTKDTVVREGMKIHPVFEKDKEPEVPKKPENPPEVKPQPPKPQPPVTPPEKPPVTPAKPDVPAKPETPKAPDKTPVIANFFPDILKTNSVRSQLVRSRQQSNQETATTKDAVPKTGAQGAQSTIPLSVLILAVGLVILQKKHQQI